MDERGDAGVVPALDHGHGGAGAVDALEPQVADVVVEDVLRARGEVRERLVVVLHVLQRGREDLDVIRVDGYGWRGRRWRRGLRGSGEDTGQQGRRRQYRQALPGETL